MTGGLPCPAGALLDRLVRVEQAQDDGDHGGFLAGRRRAEDVMTIPALGDADNHAAGGLNGLQVASAEHRQRVLPQTEAELVRARPHWPENPG